MRLLDRVAFGCVVRLPRWKLTLPPGLNKPETVGFEPTDGCTRRADFKSDALNPSATSPNGKPSDEPNQGRLLGFLLISQHLWAYHNIMMGGC